MITAMAWIVGLYLCGGLMFSYWLGLIVKMDLKQVGDGNPGAINLWKAAGVRLGLAGTALDFSKGYLPMLLFMNFNVAEGLGFVCAAAAPIAGHLWSPYLKFRGGKAIAVTFGVWSAITEFRASLAYAIILFLLLVLARLILKGKSSSEADGVQVVIGMLLLGIYLYFAGYSGSMMGVWAVNVVMLVYAHRRSLLLVDTLRQS